MDSRETLSALVDGRLDTVESPGDAVGRVCQDRELLDAWSRYHLIGDALRDQLPDAIAPDLTARVAAALESEPTVLAPRGRPPAAPVRWIAGAAVAASCAAVVLFSASLFDGGGGARVPESPGLAITSEPAPAPAQAPGTEFAARTVSTETASGQAAERGVDGDAGAAYNPYLVRHSEYRVNAGVPGMSPYARLIGHRSGGVDALGATAGARR